MATLKAYQDYSEDERYRIKKAANQWIDQFNFIPGTLIQTLAHALCGYNEYDDPQVLQLLASPGRSCPECSENLIEQENQYYCEECERFYSPDDENLQLSYPEYAYPTGWGTLFNPKTGSWNDEEWIKEHAREISAKCNVFIFENDDLGVLIGIDGGGYDFYEAHWIPLYLLRGFTWHEKEE